MKNRLVRLALWAILAGSAFSACSSGGCVDTPTNPCTSNTNPVSSIASIAVTPLTDSIVVGASTKLEAVPRNASGDAIGTATMVWASSNEAVATVSTTGLVTGQGIGSANITASAGGVTSTPAVVTVFAPVSVASIEVSPTADSMLVGAMTQFNAIAKDGSGQPANGVEFTWATSSEAIARVLDDGVTIFGQGVGTASITASVGDVTSNPASMKVVAAVGSIDLTPSPDTIIVGGMTQLTAEVRDGFGNQANGTSLTWSSSNGDIASVSASGLVTGNSSGSVTISATAFGVTGEATVNVLTGFTGAYGVSNWRRARMCPDAGCWTSTGITGGSTSVDPESGDTDPVTLAYNVSLGGGGVTQRTARFSAVATGTGTVTFDWSWAGYHAFFNARAELTVFAETASGETTTVLVNQAVSSNFQLNGSTQIEVVAGRPFGIIVGGSNFDSDARLQGSVMLTNLFGPVGGSTTIEAVDPSETTFNYDVNLGGGGVSRRTARYFLVAPESGRVSFDWEYTGFHAFFRSRAELTVFAERANGTRTLVQVNENAGGNSFSFQNSTAIDVEEGLAFGIIVGGSNFDSNSRLRGTVKISNLNVSR